MGRSARLTSEYLSPLTFSLAPKQIFGDGKGQKVAPSQGRDGQAAPNRAVWTAKRDPFQGLRARMGLQNVEWVVVDEVDILFGT